MRDSSLRKTDSVEKKASFLRLHASGLADSMKSGNFRSLYRGQGIEFSGVREYIRGDDVRSIDWNVTARMGRPYVKVFEEDRELQVFLVVDTSVSMRAATDSVSKFRSAAESAALLAVAAESCGCPLGAAFFDGGVYFSCPPESGRPRTLLLLSKLDSVPEKAVRGSALPAALACASRLLKKRSLVFVISDFRSTGWNRPLAALAHKNDVIALRITDPWDERLPRLGTSLFTDCESGFTTMLPSSSPLFAGEWEKRNAVSVQNWRNCCLRYGAAPFVIHTDDDPLKVLMRAVSGKA